MVSSRVWSFVALVLLLAGPVAAMDLEATVMQLTPPITVVHSFIAIVAFVLALMIIGHCGRILGRSFVYMIASVFVFDAIHVFFLLSHGGVLAITGTTVMIWWHLMFYTATGLFIYGLHALRTYTSNLSATGNVLNLKKYVMYVALALWLVVLFVSAAPLDAAATALFKDTLLDRIGFAHIIAIVMMGYAVYGLYHVKRMFGRTVGRSVPPFLASLAVFCAVHVWEYINETLRALPITDEASEGVEALLFLVAMGLFTLALWRIKAAIPKVE